MKSIMTEREQQRAAREFAADWQGKGYEKGQSQTFWLTLLRDVLGLEHPERHISFENQVKLAHTSFIDGYISSTSVLIEQKGINKDLNEPIRQSDGKTLTPFQQAKRYITELPRSMHPRWVVVCNFKEFHIYDMEKPQGEPEVVLLENLETDYYRLRFLVDSAAERIRRETEVSVKAGNLVGEIYDQLLAQYADPTNPQSLHSLNVLCVRLVFCLYAEDAGVFGQRNMFHDYLASFPFGKVRRALIDLFDVLDTPLDKRDPYLEDDLKAFPYVNGGLFARQDIEIPQFTAQLMDTLLQNASLDFNWSEISPTIFGAVFESTLNPDTRRSGGMHYTSIENIHRVIDPLFLNALTDELRSIRRIGAEKTRRQRLGEYQKKLASLHFLDPACGSGNFLTETYLSLRRLENEVISDLYGKDRSLGGDFSPIKVGIRQFYGIEINDFATTVATTAMWIAEAQMMIETEKIVGHDLNYLPLKSYSNIHEGNALTTDWASVVDPKELDYIMGNPPFVGARLMDARQKADLALVFGAKWRGLGNMDYVSGWYKKAAEMMFENPKIHTALVSSNSITQGEQVPLLWKPLVEQGLEINFAWRTFRWDSEASIMAHVHCVIVGFNVKDETSQVKRIYQINEESIETKHINAYLNPMEDVFIESRTTPLCDVPQIGIGNKPIDGGNYLFRPEEKEAFIRQEPKSEKYFKPWYGSDEFINNRPRYCLWLGDCAPNELRSMPLCMERVENVRKVRLASPSAGTRKLADYPTRFHVENMPKDNYIIVPSVSSERRRYVPMGFMSPEVLASNLVLIIPDAQLWHFAILTSSVHMAWMRAVCGRLKSDYRYSKDIVYNNFPWPNVTEAQKEKMAQAAQTILDARAQFPDASLADLYNEATMPPVLRQAHNANDRLVMRLYGFKSTMTESDIVARLMEMYKELV